MASPFAAYADTRLLWLREDAPLDSLRDGLKGSTQAIVIEAYGKLSGPTGEQDSGSRSIGVASCTAYFVRWAELPPRESWLAAGKDWRWNDTGLRPEGLSRGPKLQAFRGDLSILPKTTDGEFGHITIATLTDVGGIGAAIRSSGLDKLTGTFASGR